MADGKCDKCGALTSNRGNMFQCGSGMVDYSSKGAKLVKTTTSILAVVSALVISLTACGSSEVQDSAPQINETFSASATESSLSAAEPETAAAETAAGTVLPSGPAAAESTVESAAPAESSAPQETAPAGAEVVVGTAPGGEQN